MTTALLAHDPDVQAINTQIAALMTGRMETAMGELAHDLLVPLLFMLTGGLLNAGMSTMPYQQVADEMAKFADSMPWKRKRA